MLEIGLVLLITFLFVAIVLVVALEVKLDWTKDRELLLWYTETDMYSKAQERKFIKILKL